MNDRKNPEEGARTTEPDAPAEPGDERVVHRGEIGEATEQSEDPTDDRFDAG